MDEKAIELNIETYKLQLSQVQDALLAAGEADNGDLLTLREDLRELITLTEESLLNLKKEQLLGRLGQQSPGKQSPGQQSRPEASLDDEFAAFQACLADDVTKPPENSNGLKKPSKRSVGFCADSSSSSSSSDSEDEGGADFSDLVGSKCRAPFSQSWGDRSQHDAMIVSIEPLELTQDYVPKVQVLFTHPQHRAMVPCQYFLENKCTFGEHCRYSHGHSVKVTEITEYREYDHGSLVLESRCLAKWTDRVWYPALIVDVLPDHSYKVMFDTDHQVLSVSVEDILPIENHEASAPAEDEASDPDPAPAEEEVPAAPARRDWGSEDEDEDELPVFLWRPGSQEAGGCGLGMWEKHTRGIASRLMSQMGYVPGQGLGKPGREGRVEPVPIQLIPQGKSLDKIMELKAIAGNRDLFDVMKKQERKQIRDNKKMADKYENEAAADKPKNVFDFINKKLGQKQHHDPHHHHHHKPKAGAPGKPSNSSKQISERDLRDKSDKGLNIQLLRTLEEVKSTEREIQRVQEMLNRNKDKEPAVAAKLKSKLASLEKYLESLKASENSIEKQRKSRTDTKKLTVF